MPNWFGPRQCSDDITGFQLIDLFSREENFIHQLQLQTMAHQSNIFYLKLFFIFAIALKMCWYCKEGHTPINSLLQSGFLCKTFFNMRGRFVFSGKNRRQFKSSEWTLMLNRKNTKVKKVRELEFLRILNFYYFSNKISMQKKNISMEASITNSLLVQWISVLSRNNTWHYKCHM